MEDQYFESTIKALLANTAEFTSVNLSGYDLHGDRAHRLAAALAQNTNVHTLELHEVKSVTESGWAEISSSLPSQLHTLDLSECNLNQGGVFELHVCPALKRLQKVTELDLSSNSVSLPDAFFEAISSMHELSELLLQHNQIDDEGLKKLIGNLSPQAPLERMWLQNNQIGTDCRTAVLDSLATLGRKDSTQILFGN